MQIQFNAVTWVFGLLTAAGAIAGFSYQRLDVDQIRRISFLVLLSLPATASPLAFMVFDHIIMIHRIGSYVGNHLHPAIKEYCSANQKRPVENLLTWNPLSEIPRGSFLSVKYAFFFLGIWGPFFLLVPVSTISGTIAACVMRPCPAWPYISVLALDWGLSVAFLFVSIAIWNERAGWLGIKKITWFGLAKEN